MLIKNYKINVNGNLCNCVVYAYKNTYNSILFDVDDSLTEQEIKDRIQREWWLQYDNDGHLDGLEYAETAKDTVYAGTNFNYKKR